MSRIYNSEPRTHGKVKLHTSHGEVDIELWPQQAPLAVRNFVQLCLEGRYDGTSFYRVIKGFMVQGGVSGGVREVRGSDTIYGDTFKSEFNSRIKFNHRGQVACVDCGKRGSNTSDFFITLDKCEWLNGKSTIFGKVTGDSVFNILKVGDVPVDKDDKPHRPPILTRTEVMLNPFPDIKPRMAKPQNVPSETDNTDGAASRSRVPSSTIVSDGKLLAFNMESESSDSDEGDGSDGGPLNNRAGRKGVAQHAGAVLVRSVHDVRRPKKRKRALADSRPMEGEASGSVERHIGPTATAKDEQPAQERPVPTPMAQEILHDAGVSPAQAQGSMGKERKGRRQSWKRGGRKVAHGQQNDDENLRRLGFK